MLPREGCVASLWLSREGPCDNMGCRKSKEVTILDTEFTSKIKTVFTLKESSNYGDFDNNESLGLNLAEKIKHTRNKKNKVAKYDKKIVWKYDIKRVLGRGKFTKVLRVDHKLSREPFALKVPLNDGGQEMLQSEISVLQRVQHPNVITLLEVFSNDASITGIILTLTTGGDVFDRLFDFGPFSERNAVKVR